MLHKLKCTTIHYPGSNSNNFASTGHFYFLNQEFLEAVPLEDEV
jgi:hypothetical protein